MIRQKIINPIKSFIQLYETQFRINFPQAYRVYDVLKTGSSRFGSETYQFIKLKLNLAYRPERVNSLTLKEVEIIRQIPNDWKAVAPVMIISMFPLMNWLILPIAYIYPQRLLCKQFWTIEQQLKFGEIRFLHKKKYNHVVLNHLEHFLDTKLSDVDNKAKNVSIDLIQRINKGQKVEINEIIDLKSIFNRPELSLRNLSFDHMEALVSAHSCRRIVCLTHYNNLIYFSYWFIQSDHLLAQKDLNKVKLEYIYKFCFERGINANMIPLNELINYLKLWLEFSSKLNDKPLIYNQDNNYNLFLHGRFLLPRSYSKNVKILK